MNVLVAVSRFVPGGAFGAETYLSSLLGAITTLDTSTKYTVLGPSQVMDWLDNVAPPLERIESQTRGRASSFLRERDDVIAAARSAKADIVFFPFNTKPSVPVTSLLMVHDLAASFYLKHYPSYRPVRNWILKQRVSLSIRSASAVVTPTESICGEIREQYPHYRGPVIPIPEAAMNTSDRPPAERRFNEENVVLLSGSKLPHKCQDVGVKGFLRLLASPGLDSNCRLVVTGCSKADMERLNVEVGVSDAITLLPKLDAQAFAEVAAEATIHLFPTSYEGFGLGTVEAQVQGKLVVASDIPVMREVSGGHALFFPVGDIEALATKLRSAIDGTSAVDVDRAREDALSWCWEDHASRLDEVLRDIAR